MGKKKKIFMVYIGFISFLFVYIGFISFLWFMLFTHHHHQSRYPTTLRDRNS